MTQLDEMRRVAEAVRNPAKHNAAAWRAFYAASDPEAIIRFLDALGAAVEMRAVLVGWSDAIGDETTNTAWIYRKNAASFAFDAALAGLKT